MWRVQVHGTLYQGVQFGLHSKEGEPRYTPWLKLDQHVEITFGAKIAVQNRAKNREAGDVMTTSKVSDLVFRQWNLGGNHIGLAMAYKTKRLVKSLASLPSS